MNKFICVNGVGSYLPKQILTNEELERRIDTSSEWIESRVGIKERHIAASNENATTMAFEAAKQALNNSSVSVSDIDLIIVATSTANKLFPSVACQLQNLLKIDKCVAFDLQAACSGFVYGLHVAEQMMKTGAYRNALVVGSEVMSRLLDWEDRSTCVLFGDGAGAMLLSQSNEPGIISSYMTSEGKFNSLLYADNKLTGEEGVSDSYVKMNGKEVYKLAVDRLEWLVVEMLQQAEIDPSQLDWLVPHQANYRIIKSTVKKINFPLDKVVLTLKEHGNTSCASIPLAFDHAVKDGRIKKGHTVFLEAFGAGITFGGILLRY